MLTVKSNWSCGATERSSAVVTVDEVGQDSRKPRRPRTRASIIAVLGAGALLDAVDRLGLEPSRLLAIVCGVVAFTLLKDESESGQRFVSLGPEVDRGRSRLLVAVLAWCVSALLISSDVVRFVRRGSHSGFPIWLSDLYHEDNSTWISFGTSSSTGDWLDAQNFGYGFALILSALDGAVSVAAALLGTPLTAVGIPITAVGLGYVLLVAAVPLLVLPIVQVVMTRSSSWIATIGVGFGVTVFTLRFMREARDLGHLTAGVAVAALLYSLSLLSANAKTLHTGSTDPIAMWCLSFSCLLWFPLRPLALVFAFVAFWVDIRGIRTASRLRGSPWLSRTNIRGLVFLIAVGFRAMPDVGTYLAPSSRSTTKALVDAAGGTYEVPDVFLLFGSVLVFGVLSSKRIGTRLERFVLSTIVLFVIGIRFVDQIASPDFEYGSTKMLWILLPPIVALSILLLARDVAASLVTEKQFGALFLGISLLLANSTSYFGVARILGPFIWSDVRGSFVELDNLMAKDDYHQWDEPGGLNLQQTRSELPIICMMIDQTDARPLPLWEFEPYRCTRKVSELSMEHSRSRETLNPALDQLWKEYALLDRGLTEAVMGSLESGNDLSRDTLLVNREGELIARERTIDLLAQIALSDPITVRSQQQWDGSLSGVALHSIDSFDPDDGQLDLWVENNVVALVLIGNLDSEEARVERKPRPDVADLLGRDELLSGVTIKHPAIGPTLRCLVLVDRQSNGTVAWSKGELCG